MAGSLRNFHKMDSRSACIQGVLKVKVKVKGHVIRALSWILGMSYSVIDGLVSIFGSTLHPATSIARFVRSFVALLVNILFFDSLVSGLFWMI